VELRRQQAFTEGGATASEVNFARGRSTECRAPVRSTRSKSKAG